MESRSKDTVRELAIASRDARSSEDIRFAGLALAGQDWAALCPGDLVTAFMSMNNEPPTEGVREALAKLGKKVALPIMRPKRLLEWGYDGTTLIRNSYGILEPEPAEIDISQASAIIIPALRVGLDGSRLGRGAGYYDRALERVPAHSIGGPLRICLVFDEDVDDTVPHESHDAPIDVIVTPNQVIRITK
jgi:5-formyltetrahydrofolate cyclo-ligase